MKASSNKIKSCFLERLLWQENRYVECKTKDNSKVILIYLVKKDIKSLCFWIASEMEKSEDVCYILRSWAPQDLIDYAGVKATLES